MDGVENSENPWPEEFAELKSIEESLTCGICYEYIQTAVMTPCSHNYCTLCIRRYLNFKNECPACFNAVHDTDLKVNRSLDNIKQSFVKLHENLKLCLKGVSVRSVRETSSPVKSRINQIMTTPKSACKSPNSFRNDEAITPVKSNRVSNPQTPSRIDSTTHGENIEKHLSSPGTSAIAPIFNNPVRYKILGKKENIGPTVPCPVCSVSVSETHINRHLDDCLKRQNNTSGPVQLESKLKSIPKLVLNLMKDTELRRRLKEYGCSTAGDSKALKGRLNRFYILYNAERDKTVQRPIGEIVKQCEEEEQLERRATTSTTGNILTFSKPIIVKPVKGQNEIYCEANKSSFNKLIEQVRKRNPRNKAAEEKDSSSLDEDPVTEAVTNVSNDSDSGTSGHQQRYWNEGTTISDNAENNRSVDLVDADSNCDGIDKQQGNSDMLFSSLIEDSSNDSENEETLNPVFNKRLASHTLDGVTSSSNSDLNNSKSDTMQKPKWTFKKPRMSKPLVDNSIQELDRLLENFDDDDHEIRDISLDTTADSVESDTSKVAENEEVNENIQIMEPETHKVCDKENKPSSELDLNTFQRPVRKRGRPRKFDSGEDSPTKTSQHLQNALHELSIYKVDDSLDDVDSSPEKIVKRRKAVKQNNTESESEPETPTRNLRKRQNLRTPSKYC